MTYKKGQLVRSRGGYPARALGIESFCLRKTASGRLLLDTIRHTDASVQTAQVPADSDLEGFLASHQEAHRAAQARAGALQKPSTQVGTTQKPGPSQPAKST